MSHNGGDTLEDIKNRGDGSSPSPATLSAGENIKITELSPGDSVSLVVGNSVVGSFDVPEDNSAPTATITTSDNPSDADSSGTIVFTHGSGDSMDAKNLYITVSGERINVAEASAADWSAPSGLSQLSVDADSTFGASSTITLTFADGGTTSPTVASGDTVSLEFDDGTNSNPLATHDATADFGYQS